MDCSLIFKPAGQNRGVEADFQYCAHRFCMDQLLIQSEPLRSQLGFERPMALHHSPLNNLATLALRLVMRSTGGSEVRPLAWVQIQEAACD